ncbi:tyrosine-protein phosphatase [Candidatus Enterococcus willemsii]|uniref:Tyrosine specific protein phosphatases domain-containing protein n=1 Tax=Candidatus Enterococcus willemsii TaxID=1857215 RepID=A0ABQ6Z2E4_9ENTE|nr:tyrosine-protein phosphatase [Enterococcus sp. CU12B]KAF1305207.1 hypothetical protein BAU17_12590 [Enterococcus sp. CU12B]
METITNFRDLGGLTTRDGKRISDKKLLRSGELSRVSIEEQQVLLNEFHLEKIVDLRSLDEVTERPDKVFEKTDYVHIDIFKDITDEGASLDDFIKIGSAERSREYMHTIYQTMTVNPSAQAGFTQMIETALSIPKQNSFLFHCFAGKDRTGISAALLLEILNVPKETIYQDYLATNKFRVKENQEVIQLAIDNGANQGVVEALEVALNVEAPFLDTFYQTVDKEFGGIELYLKDSLRISPSMQEDLRRLILVD